MKFRKPLQLCRTVMIIIFEMKNSNNFVLFAWLWKRIFVQRKLSPPRVILCKKKQTGQQFSCAGKKKKCFQNAQKKKTCTKHTDIHTFNFHSTFGNLKKKTHHFGRSWEKKRKAQRKKTVQNVPTFKFFIFIQFSVR